MTASTSAHYNRLINLLATEVKKKGFILILNQWLAEF